MSSRNGTETPKIPLILKRYTNNFPNLSFLTCHFKYTAHASQFHKRGRNTTARYIFLPIFLSYADRWTAMLMVSQCSGVAEHLVRRTKHLAEFLPSSTFRQVRHCLFVFLCRQNKYRLDTEIDLFVDFLFPLDFLVLVISLCLLVVKSLVECLILQYRP